MKSSYLDKITTDITGIDLISGKEIQKITYMKENTNFSKRRFSVKRSKLYTQKDFKL